MVWNMLWNLVADRMSWSTQSVQSQWSDTGSQGTLTPPSSWEEESVYAEEKDTESPCINPRLLERTENMSCCWFDISLEGVSQKTFERLFNQYPKGTYKTRVLCCVNSCILYGVWVDVGKKPSGDMAILGHDFPKWVHFEHPIGDEEREAFFQRLSGCFLRTQVEALSGHSVREIL